MKNASRSMFMNTREIAIVSSSQLVALCALAAILAPTIAAAADCPVSTSLRGQWDQDNGNYGDIWAEGDVAYMAQWGDNKVHFMDISNPDNPTRILEWVVGSPNQFSSAQDVKVGDGLLFISLESDGNDGVEIVDVRDPFNPVHLSWIKTPSMAAVHNTFYDNGYLYVVNSATPQVAVVDLTNYDPDNPPVRIDNHLWLITAGNAFVHDITVQDGVLYACGWDSGLFVFDVSNIANEAPVFLGSGSGNNTHAVWPSADGRWAVVGEERSGGPVKLYEIIPNGGGVDVVLRDTVAMPGSESHSAHNPVVIGTRVYVSWYQAGLVILDIDEDNALLIERGRYDTFGGGVQGFNGAWGVYPFLGEDRLLVSDLSNGIFIIRADSQLSISYPEGLVTTVDPNEGAVLRVEIGTDCGDPDLNTARVVVDVTPEEGGVQEIPLIPLGGDLYEAHLPGAPCGSDYTYYVAIENLLGETTTDPPGAPAETYSAAVLSSVELLFADNFDTNNGWTATNEHCAGETDTGFWERVSPIGTSRAPGEDYPGGEGTLCYVTDQGPPGGGDGNSDVDGGPFYLTSPSIAVNNQDALLSYARWFSTNDPAGLLVIEASGDDGTNWVSVENVSDSGSSWVVRELLISDFMPPGETLTLRYSTSDCPNSNLTEAALDEVSVMIILCEDFDETAPEIVHNGGASTNPFSGYIDPRRESDNGVDLNQGINTTTILFSEPVFNIGGAPLDASAFTVTSTGTGPPTVAAIDATNNPLVVLTLDARIVPGSWYTIAAAVEDAAGNVILNSGNQGPGVNETDRVDVAFLPADVDQTGEVSPFDLLEFRQIVQNLFDPPQGTDEDFVDTDRNGEVTPFDLLAFRQLVNGIPPATQTWSGATLDAPRP